MPDQPTIASLFRDAGKLLRANFDAIRSMNPHAGEGGAEVEDILKHFLNEHLPQRFHAGSGIVIDSNNTLSRQQDVVIYDALSSPLYRYGPTTQIIPMDAVVTTIEVKSRLTKDELTDAYAKIASCKALKKRPMTQSEFRQNRGGTFHGTTGIVFAFESAATLETVLEHAKELNQEYESSLWPEMIVVLDRGLITYVIQYPGAPRMAGSLMSVGTPPGWARGCPPWYVHLAVHRDTEFALNRFFMTLLAQLAYFPVLPGVPPFEVILEGSNHEVLTRTGYQFDLGGALRPAPESSYITDSNEPTVDIEIDIFAGQGGPRVAALQFLPWQDGSVIRAFGAQPTIQELLVALSLPRDTMLVVDPSEADMWLTTITKITESDFRRWASLIERRTRFRTRLVRGNDRTP